MPRSGNGISHGESLEVFSSALKKIENYQLLPLFAACDLHLVRLQEQAV